MKLASESKLVLNGTSYSLLKATAQGVDGAVLIVDEPGKAQDKVFFPSEALKALLMLVKQS